MNRRTLKKKCKRAMAELIRRGSYRTEDFRPADGEESIYAPMTMERQYTRHARRPHDNGFLEPGPLKGTPLLMKRTSYEYDEWDNHLASDILEDELFWETATEDDFAELAAA